MFKVCNKIIFRVVQTIYGYDIYRYDKVRGLKIIDVDVETLEEVNKIIQEESQNA